MIEKLIIIFVLSSIFWTTPLSPVVSVEDGQVYAIGETATVNITLSEAPNGLSGYNISISLSNASIAEIISVSFPDWATLHSNSSLPADSVWIKAADLSDKIKSGEKNITLSSLIIRGDDYGSTEIVATVTKMDDDNGNPINPSVKHGKFDPASSLIYFDPQNPKAYIGLVVAVNLTLDKAPNGLSGYNLSVFLSNPEIAEIVSVDFPEWATLHTNSSLPGDSVWIKCVDLNDEIKRGDKNISLATLTLRGDEQGKTDLIIMITKIDDDDGNLIDTSTAKGGLEVMKAYFDTGSPNKPYPSISGTHNGTIKPNHTVIATKLYTYPCEGTGGHTEYARIWNSTWSATAAWKGYAGDWHNITFDKPVILLANEEYNYTIRTGSYPQIIHAASKKVTGGTITCTQFTDANGRTYNNWIPAIRLE